MKGVGILLGIILVAAVMCYWVPFVLMPGAGVAVALPVIMVPGEKVWTDFLGVEGLTITNTVIGTVVADILVLLFALGATRNMKQVPGRLQGLFEILTDALYGLAKSTAGKNARKIFPLMATIFLFLLIANWVKLLPGAESVGLMHCAHDGVNGYPANGSLLKVDKPIYAGVRATEENYELCHHAEQHGEDPLRVALYGSMEVAIAQQMGAESFDIKDKIDNGTAPLDYLVAHELDAEAVIEAATPLMVADLEALMAEEELHGEEAEHVEHAIEHPADVLEEAINEPYFRDDLHAVTPFVRGAATDLNLTLGLGLLAFLAIQFFGVQALGVGYFSKFLNTPALANVGKRPMGAMDFVVGLLEIISELAKVISFGFRLFGNLFAGGVLLFVMSFLVAMLVPAGVYVLELFVGLIQAFVFAMLLLVFSSIAMQGHDHGEEHH